MTLPIRRVLPVLLLVSCASPENKVDPNDEVERKSRRRSEIRMEEMEKFIKTNEDAVMRGEPLSKAELSEYEARHGPKPENMNAVQHDIFWNRLYGLAMERVNKAISQRIKTEGVE